MAGCVRPTKDPNRELSTDLNIWSRRETLPTHSPMNVIDFSGSSVISDRKVKTPFHPSTPTHCPPTDRNSKISFREDMDNTPRALDGTTITTCGDGQRLGRDMALTGTQDQNKQVCTPKKFLKPRLLNMVGPSSEAPLPQIENLATPVARKLQKMGKNSLFNFGFKQVALGKPTDAPD